MKKIAIPDSFKEKEPIWAFFITFINMLVVVFSGVIAWHVNIWWVYAIAFILVAARVQALYILQHECMHWLMFKKKKQNDIMGAVLSGMIGTKLYEGRVMHFKHHKDLGHDTDPNTYYYALNDRHTFTRKIIHFLLQLFGIRLVEMAAGILGLRKPVADATDIRTISKNDLRKDLLYLVGSQLTIIILITLLSSFWVYLLMYFLPIVTLSCFFESIRSFSEHALPGDTPTCYAEEHRLFLMDANHIELFLISQFQFNYHHLHHLYPYVVTFKLKKLHEWLSENDAEYESRYIKRPGYLRVLIDFLLNRDFSGSGNNYPKIKTA